MTTARLLLLALLSHPALAQGPSPGSVNAAIDRGVEWLLRSQQLDGSWDYGEEPRVGHTALIAYTLIKSGLSPKHHAVQRVIASLAGESTHQTYDAALMILALTAHDRSQHAAQVQDLVDQLVDWQKPAGLGYPAGNGDLSNTQYAALGLWAAARAGADVPQRTWFDLIQAALGYQTSDGGFSYRQGESRATGSMTAAGVGVLAICRDLLRLGDPGSDRRRARKIEDAIEGGLGWLAQHFAVDQNPGRGRAHLGYYLYGLERVGALAPVDRIGDHDWYQEGAGFLVRGQAPQGHWGASLGGGHPQTCFALLFLRRATAPVTGGLHRSGGRRYDQEESGAEVRIAAAGDNPLGMWIAGIGRDTRDALEWPQEAGQGLRVARVVWLVDGVEATRVAGDEDRPAGHARFEHRVEFSEPGAHELQAEVHVLRPPRRDTSGRAYPASLTLLRSPPLAVEVADACPTWMLDNARDRARNLMPLGRPRVEASTSRSGHGPARALDQHQGRSWLAAQRDEHPTLSIELGVPQEANVVLVGHARENPIEPGRWARALEVDVLVNGERHRLRMHSDERRKGRLVLPRPVVVRELELTVPLSAPGLNGERSVGFAEVELQLRPDLGQERPRR